MIGTTIGQYEIEKELGKGGMGVVYLARDARLNRLVALKFVSPFLTQDPEIRERFKREAQAAAAIEHNNICTVHDIAETDDGRTYIVMAYYGGETLSELLKKGPVSPDETRRICLQVASALAAAHKAGIYHRDIKPGNIGLTKGGDVKLLDFGLAKLTGAAEITKSGKTIGTVAYMSPEQIRGERADHRADLWSLGVVMYEMLTGQRPFRGEYEQALAYTIQNESPEKLTTDQAGENSIFSSLIDSLLEKDRDARIASAQEVVGVLESGESVPSGGGSTSDLGSGADSRSGSGSRSSSGSGFRPMVRRGKTPLVAGTVVALIIVAVLIWKPWETGDDIPVVVGSGTSTFQKIAVLPFSIITTPEFHFWRDGLVDLLTTNLDGAGAWRTVDSRKILSTTSGPVNRSLTTEDAREYVRSLGASLFVLGSAVEAGGEVRIRAVLYRVDGALEPVGEAKSEGSDLFEMADNLAQQLLASVGGAQSARVSKIASMTTGSIDAYKAYLDGESAFRQSNFPAALDGFQRATEIDSTFAMAWYRISTTSNWLIRPTIGLKAAKKAVLNSDPLSDRDRSLLLAQLAFQRGVMEETEALYRQHIATYPEETEAIYNLAELFFHNGSYFGKPFRESKTMWNQLLELEPDNVPGLVHLARIAVAESDTSEFLALFDRIGSLGDRASELLVFKTFMTDDPEDVERAIVSLRNEEESILGEVITMIGLIIDDESKIQIIWNEIGQPTRSNSVKSMGLIFQSQMMMMRGEFEKALQVNDIVMRLGPPKAILYRHYQSLLPFRVRNGSELDQTILELERWDTEDVVDDPIPGPLFSIHNGLYPVLQKYLLGVALVKKGKLQQAERMADELESIHMDPGEEVNIYLRLAAGIRGRIAVKENRNSEAEAFFREATAPVFYSTRILSPFFSGSSENYLLAGLLESRGQLDEALKIYQLFDDASIFERVFQVPSALKRAMIYEKTGDTQAALELIRKAESLWSRADEEFRPMLNEVTDLKKRLKTAQ